MRLFMRRVALAIGVALLMVVPTMGRAVASGTAVLAWTPTTSAGVYDFGAVAPGQSVTKTFTLTNSGGVATSALAMGLTGSSAFTKTADTCLATSIGPKKTCTVTIRFAPTALGQVASATLTGSSKKPAASASLTLRASGTKAAPSISTTPSAGGPLGTKVKDTATLSGGSAPTGSVRFKLYGPSATANCSGTALDDETVTVSGNGSYATPAGFTPTQVGTYWWTAAYAGDPANASVASACGTESVTITQAGPALGTTPSPGGPIGTKVKDTATLSGGVAPTGSIRFKLYGPSATASCSGTPLDDETVTVSGNGSYTTPAGFTPTQVGTYWWTAAYGGNPGNAAVSSTCGSESVSISKASTSLSTSPSADGALGTTTVTDTATIAGGVTPTGSVEFKLYGPSATADCSGAALDDETVAVSGNGSYTTPAGFTPTQLGTYWWTAHYTGDAANTSATSSCGDESVTIGKAVPTFATHPSADGAIGTTTVTDTATVSGGSAPTGSITFKLYGPSATADCSGTPLDDETVTVTGNDNYPTPGGFTPTQVGTYWWTAHYTGDAANQPGDSACGDESVTITKAVPTLATSASDGGKVPALVVDTATLSGGYFPTGLVTFKLFGPSVTADCTGTAAFTKTTLLSGGQAFASANPTAPGTYWWTAHYAGDGHNETADSSCGDESVTMTKATPSLTTTPSAGGTVGKHVTDSALFVNGYVATGTIEFKLFGPSATAACAGTALDDETVTVSGSNNYPTPTGFTPTTPGTYWWTAHYSGDAKNEPADSACGAESVTLKAAPTIATSPSPHPGGDLGDHLTDSAQLTGGFSATGSIQFKLYGPSTTATCTGTPVDDETVSVTGDGSYPTPAGFTPTQVGTYWWTAHYTGDARNAAADSACGLESVAIVVPHLYWSSASGTINKANGDGSNATVIVTAPGTPGPLAADATHVFWRDTTNKRLWESDADGSNAAPDPGLDGFDIGAIDLNGADIYWTERSLADFAKGTIASFNHGFDGERQFPSFGNSGLPIGLAVDSNWTYWTGDAGAIGRSDHQGNGTTTLVTGQGGATALAVDAAHLYWTNPSTGEILRADLDGSNVTVIAHEVAPTAITVIGSHVYWGTAGGKIVRANLDGSNSSTIITAAGGIPLEGLAATP